MRTSLAEASWLLVVSSYDSAVAVDEVAGEIWFSVAESPQQPLAVSGPLALVEQSQFRGRGQYLSSDVDELVVVRAPCEVV